MNGGFYQSINEAKLFSGRLTAQLKANGHPVSATYIARQIHVTPHAARLWLTGVNIPKEQNMQVKWLKVAGQPSQSDQFSVGVNRLVR
jgi:hypothetical protein